MQQTFAQTQDLGHLRNGAVASLEHQAHSLTLNSSG